MTWSLYRWVWQLQSPLFAGVPPAGTLNRCRLCIPARTMWGALTAEVARLRKGVFPDYEVVGQEMKERVRFTYLYPAERVRGEWRAWLPCYKEDKGLCWRQENSNDRSEPLSNRAFRMRLLDARPGTAIDPDTRSAADGTLHETECIQPYWRDGTSPNSPVAMVGYVFVRSDDSLWDEIGKLDTLFVGGDTRYGLGHLRRAGWVEAENVFGMRTYLSDGDFPIVESDCVFAHSVGICCMKGALEVLAGWDRPSDDRLLLIHPNPLWVPGSACANSGGKTKWAIDAGGIWREQARQTAN